MQRKFRKRLPDICLTVEVLAEKAGDSASRFLYSDAVATYALAILCIVAGVLFGYALARGLL